MNAIAGSEFYTTHIHMTNNLYILYLYSSMLEYAYGAKVVYVGSIVKQESDHVVQTFTSSIGQWSHLNSSLHCSRLKLKKKLYVVILHTL